MLSIPRDMSRRFFLVFNSCTTKVDSEPPHGSNVDIPNIYVCKQTLDLSAVSTEVHQAAETVTTSNELDLLFGPLFDEYFNGENQVVLKSSAVTTTDASNKRQQPDSTSSTSTLATTVTANGNFDLSMRHEVLRIHWGYSFGESCIKDLAKAKKDEPKEVKETPKEWIVEEEIAFVPKESTKAEIIYSSWSSWTALALSTAVRIGRLLGGGFAFSIAKNGIVNEYYEQTHKEKIDYEKANILELKFSLDRNQASRAKLNND
ncbi:hypothetical protein Tco_1220761 [Tanacetum coccineum]